jgi:hypothetical protein
MSRSTLPEELAQLLQNEATTPAATGSPFQRR